ncbi:MAG: hypothetical protein ABSE41_14090 [Bacteroidota bacterium]
MRIKCGAVISIVLFFLMACADHGTMSLVATGSEEQGAIAFRMLKSETPSDAWVIEARLEREGYATLKQSVLVRASPDTIKITMNSIPTGSWKITVDAKDSTGTLRYTGTSFVQIVEGQTVQATVQMNPTGTSGNLEIIVTWPSAASHLQVLAAGSYFVVQQMIPVSITNVSRETVIPASCCTRPDLRIQQKINGTWTPPGACELMCPSSLLPMKPGQRIMDSSIHIAQPGLYRLLLRYWTNTPQGSTLAFETTSNEFNVVGTRRDTIRLGEEFVLRFGERVSLPDTNVTLVFQDVTEDSRCPDGVVCVWEGNARILLGVNQSTVTLNTTLDPKKASFGRYVIRLNCLSPYPMIDRRTQKKEYVAALVVTTGVAGDSH